MKYFLDQLEDTISEKISAILGVSQELIRVESANENIGADLAIPLFRFAKDLQAPPADLAQKVVLDLRMPEADKVEATSGYVNIWLKPDAVARGLFDDVARAKSNKRSFGDNSDYYQQEVVIEYTDPNPFKEFHIGHVYSNTVGESISRLFEAGLARVHRVSYHGDVGMHIAKAMWGLLQELKEQNITMAEVSRDQRSAFLGAAYARGAKAFDENELIKADIKKLNKEIYALDNHELKAVYETGRAWSFEYFEEIYKRLEVGFERQYFERDTGKQGLEIVRKGLEQEVFEQSDGAIIFKGEDYGLHTRVFVNSQGLPTYEAKDLGLAFMKYADYRYDRSIIITGNEVDSYFKVVLKALELMEPEQAANTQHVSHGMVKLTSGKMSSRTGKVVTAVAVLDEVEDHIRRRAPDSPSIRENTLGAIKYAFLRQNVGDDLAFDINESISLEGNSGVYVQYASVRVGSILAKAGDQSRLPHDGYEWEAERELLLHVVRYPQVVTAATEGLAPHEIAHYVYELARRANRYYETTTVLDDGAVATPSRLALLEVMQAVYGHALHLLGIEVPERM